jgi:hypothetical protein
VKSVLPFRINRLWLISVLALVVLAAAWTPVRADETSILRGRVLDARRLPLSRAVVTVEGRTALSVRTDEDGAFALAGLAAGTYAVRVESTACVPQRISALIIEPSSCLYVKFVLQTSGELPLPGEDPVVVDESPLATRTTISASQIENLPTAHSLWSLIENQDFSATTDRIDVGGLWETRPALFSARGATSWTQNVYRLNGMDVSDPYTTGRPLFVPDFFALAATQMSNADHPASAFHPGGLLTLIPREATPDFRGGFSGYYIDKSMSASNITPDILQEGLSQSQTLNNLTEFNLHFSGPIAGPALQFFASVTSQSVNRNTADFERDDTSLLYSGLVQVRYERPNSMFRFFWTGQKISDPTLGAGRFVPFDSTIRRNDTSNLLQVSWETPPQEAHRFRAGLGYAGLRSTGEYQSALQGPPAFDLFQVAAGTPHAGSDGRSRFAGWFEGESVFTRILGADHLLEYGFQVSMESAASRLDVRDNIHLYTFNGAPAQVAFVDAPREERENGVTLNLYARETLHFGRFALFFGANLGLSRAGNSSASIRWTNLAPHFGLDIPLAAKERSRLRLSAARYYFTLPLSYLAYGNPDAPGLSVYAWNDLNHDGAYQPGEKGPLLRREGPLYGGIDPAIKRPYTDELAAAWINDLGRGWFFTLAGFQRETRNLVATINTGVQASDYTPLTIEDDGDDRIPGSYDDLTFTVYNQNPGSLGNDFYFLSNPGGRVSRYVGLDLTLVKRAGPDFLFYLALTATHAVATTNPGNTEYENDDGVLGPLYENPNAAINAKGRPRFDRAYTGRIGVSFKAPLGTRIGAVVKYYDGQPFARKIVVSDLNQGLIYIQAHPRGVARYEYNMTIDLRIEKDFSWKQGMLRLFLDGFNILNRNLATSENEWTGPSFPLRYATEIQSPRVFRVGLNFEF